MKNAFKNFNLARVIKWVVLILFSAIWTNIATFFIAFSSFDLNPHTDYNHFRWLVAEGDLLNWVTSLTILLPGLINFQLESMLVYSDSFLFNFSFLPGFLLALFFSYSLGKLFKKISVK